MLFFKKTERMFMKFNKKSVTLFAKCLAIIVSASITLSVQGKKEPSGDGAPKKSLWQSAKDKVSQIRTGARETAASGFGTVAGLAGRGASEAGRMAEKRTEGSIGRGALERVKSGLETLSGKAERKQGELKYVKAKSEQSESNKPKEKKGIFSRVKEKASGVFDRVKNEAGIKKASLEKKRADRKMKSLDKQIEKLEQKKQGLKIGSDEYKKMNKKIDVLNRKKSDTDLKKDKAIEKIEKLKEKRNEAKTKKINDDDFVEYKTGIKDKAKARIRSIKESLKPKNISEKLGKFKEKNKDSLLGKAAGKAQGALDSARLEAGIKKASLEKMRSERSKKSIEKQQLKLLKEKNKLVGKDNIENKSEKLKAFDEKLKKLNEKKDLAEAKIQKSQDKIDSLNEQKKTAKEEKARKKEEKKLEKVQKNIAKEEKRRMKKGEAAGEYKETGQPNPFISGASVAASVAASVVGAPTATPNPTKAPSNAPSNAPAVDRSKKPLAIDKQFGNVEWDTQSDAQRNN